MKFNELFVMQRELDTFIENTQNIKRDVFKEKGLALMIELAELANETRCFKFWSTKVLQSVKLFWRNSWILFTFYYLLEMLRDCHWKIGQR